MTESIAIVPAKASSVAAAKEKRRIGGLDVLRGLAAVAVVIFHYGYNYQRLFHGRSGHSPLEFGALGVQLFFIISGFVIFMTLEKTAQPIDFVRSRFSRLFPAYWAAVALTFLVLTLFPFPPAVGFDAHKYHPTLVRGILNLTMCQEMLGVGHLDAVYWTLQLELCFYFLMFLLFVTRQLGRVEFYLLGVLAVGEMLQQVFPPSSPWLAHHHAAAMAVADLKMLAVCGPSTAPHNHLHVFLIGIMLYKLSRRFSPWHLGVLLLCLGYSFVREFGRDGSDFYFTVAFTAAVYAAARGWLSFLENRVTLFLGAISYSLYLTHQNIGYELIRVMEKRGIGQVAAIAIAGGIALLIAAALTYAVERPALRLLRSRRASVPATGRSRSLAANLHLEPNASSN